MSKAKQLFVTNNSDLILIYRKGVRLKYLFFWGHQPRIKGKIDQSCLSQWYPAAFKVDNITYATAEHFMMAEKARLFQDDNALAKILAASHPGAAKKFGRQVHGFQENVWQNNRFDIVVRGSLAKFSQNSALKTFLLNSHRRILVEASPHDKIWGIGLAADDPHAKNPLQWKGLNLLGYALMSVRKQLIENEATIP